MRIDRPWHCIFGNFPDTIDTTGVHKQCTPCLSLLDAKDGLTMIASFMAQLIFRGEFRVTWGTVCHQDAFATVLVGPPHAFQSTSGTNTRRALRRRLSRFGSCSIIYVCKPTRDPKAWRSPSIASCTCASHMNVIAPPHPTQTPYLKSSTTTGAVFHPLAYTCRYIHGIHAWYMLHCVVSEYLHTSEYIYIYNYI